MIAHGVTFVNTGKYANKNDLCLLFILKKIVVVYFSMCTLGVF